MHKFRENILESSRNVSEMGPRARLGNPYVLGEWLPRVGFTRSCERHEGNSWLLNCDLTCRDAIIFTVNGDFASDIPGMDRH